MHTGANKPGTYKSRVRPALRTWLVLLAQQLLVAAFFFFFFHFFLLKHQYFLQRTSLSITPSKASLGRGGNFLYWLSPKTKSLGLKKSLLKRLALHPWHLEIWAHVSCRAHSRLECRKYANKPLTAVRATPEAQPLRHVPLTPLLEQRGAGWREKSSSKQPASNKLLPGLSHCIREQHWRNPLHPCTLVLPKPCLWLCC